MRQDANFEINVEGLVNERRLSDTTLKGSEYHLSWSANNRTNSANQNYSESAGDVSDSDKGEAILVHFGREEGVGVLLCKSWFPQ